MYKHLIEGNYISEMAPAINGAVEVCHGLAKEAGWHEQPREVGTLLMLVVSEISEAMEGVRKNLKDDKLPQYNMFDVELADAVIRIFDIAGLYNINLGQIMLDKLKFNSNREDHKKENREKEGGKKF